MCTQAVYSNGHKNGYSLEIYIKRDSWGKGGMRFEQEGFEGGGSIDQ